MNLAKLALLILPMLFALSSDALATHARLGAIEYEGEGCPSGSVSALLSPDAKYLSVLFGSFQSFSGGKFGKLSNRKSCSVFIPILTDQKQSVSITKAELRGFTGLPSGAKAWVESNYSFSSSSSQTAKKVYFGERKKNFQFQLKSNTSHAIVSPCAEAMLLKSVNQLEVITPTLNTVSSAMIDRPDIGAGVVYELSWRPCKI